MGVNLREDRVYTIILGGVGAAAALYLAQRAWQRRDRPKASFSSSASCHGLPA